MKNLFNFFLLFILTLNFIYTQCNLKIISYYDGKYIGCVNYEGEKHGKGTMTLNLDTQTQIQEGVFDDLLIGIGFLKKFKEVLWSLNSNLMRFYK